MKDNLNIVLLDTEQLLSDMLAVRLKELPFINEVYPCGNATELWDTLDKHTVHLVFLNLNLLTDRYTGFDICRQVKEKNKKIFIAILTEYNDRKFASKAHLCGAGAYLVLCHSGVSLSRSVSPKDSCGGEPRV